MKVTIQAVFPQSTSSAETDKTLKVAVKEYVSTMKGKLTEGLGVPVAMTAVFAEGRKPSFSTKITARFGGKNNVVLAGIVVYDKDAVKPNAGRFDSKAVIACNGSETNFSRWCKKNSIDPMFNAVKLRSILTKYAKESGASVKPKAVTPAPDGSNAVKPLFNLLSTAGLTNLSIEKHSGGTDVVWRNPDGSSAYSITVSGIQHLQTSYVVSKCIGPSDPGRGLGPTASTTKVVKTLRGEDELKAFFDKLKPRTATPKDTPTTTLLKALLEQVSVVGARKKPFSAKDLTVAGMSGPAMSGALRKLVTKGTLEKGEVNGTYKVVVTPGQLKKLISVSRSKHRSHSAGGITTTSSKLTESEKSTLSIAQRAESKPGRPFTIKLYEAQGKKAFNSNPEGYSWFVQKSKKDLATLAEKGMLTENNGTYTITSKGMNVYCTPTYTKGGRLS